MSRFHPVMWVALLAVSLVRCTVPSLEDLWREKGFCAAGDADCGMLRVRVDATGFVPGCLRFVAKDDASEETRTVSVPYRGTEQQGKTLTQGFSPLKSWSLAVSVSVEAFEQACDGSAVTTQRRQSTLREGGVSELAFALVATDADGDGYVSTATGGTDCNDVLPAVNPGAAELCDGKDDNCNGGADDGLGLGDACTTGEGCTGVRSCGENAAVVCVAPAVQYAWADEDRDGHGDLKQGQVPVCTAQLPLNRVPLSAPHDDCDDDNSAVKPGAPERCNNQDDNCAGGPDEGFDIGADCLNSQTQCAGSIQCNVSGGEAQCQPLNPVPTWYLDDDNDSHGQGDAGVMSCPRPAGSFVLQGGDCDDGNPFIHASARELCDEQDNDCDGVRDEQAACAMPPSWAPRTVGDGGTTWRDVAIYGDGGVWLVGSDSARAVKHPGNSEFNVLPGKCTATSTERELYSVWVSPQTGVAYVGGENDTLAIQTVSSVSCNPTKPPSGNGTTSGLKGFVYDGGVSVFGVAVLNAGAGGGTFEWDGGSSAVVSVVQYPNTPLLGLDGPTPALLFAVGSTGANRGVILRYVVGSSVWSRDVSVPAGVEGLSAVCVVGPNLAFAVGSRGAFLRWNGESWVVVPGPFDTIENLTDVLAFGSNSVYVTSDQGNVYRYDGQAWTKSQFFFSLYGIQGRSPEDIWVVGRFGNVLRYPYWPQ